ncbi:Fic/DOC family protein [Mesorhizobium australicum]|uniref:Fic/DOC family protein n=1 Tax=Mesorhizobium australicum TaxID=536018 RepID=UPI0032AF64A8
MLSRHDRPQEQSWNSRPGCLVRVRDHDGSRPHGERTSPGKLDKAHYYALHRHFFQDVYDWAGKPRTIRIGKGGNWFCYPAFIEGELNRLFGDLRKKKHLVGLPLDGFAREAAHFIAEVNAIHPFREGNGRTQLAFLRLLCLNAGWRFDASVLERERVISAMIASFDGMPEALTELVRDIASPKP